MSDPYAADAGATSLSKVFNKINSNITHFLNMKRRLVYRQRSFTAIYSCMCYKSYTVTIYPWKWHWHITATLKIVIAKENAVTFSRINGVANFWSSYREGHKNFARYSNIHDPHSNENVTSLGFRFAMFQLFVKIMPSYKKKYLSLTHVLRKVKLE